MTINTGNNYVDSLIGNSAGTAAPKSNGVLDQAAFLKLLTTQMQTQDPFNPVDNTQMVAQMAQFSSTTGIAEMNQSLKNISTALASSRVGDAAGWIGKAALVESKLASALGNGSYAGTAAIAQDAARVDINLVDSDGTIVYTASASDVKAGQIPFHWDGKDPAGNAVAGPLKISVFAKDAAGQSIDASTASWATVTGVQSPASGATKIVTPLGTIDPAEALQLS